MGFDISLETVSVLKSGFQGPPPYLERGETAAFASWVREPYGAVFFIRRWKNGEWDTDLAITTQDLNGNWLEPGSYGGSGWWDPYDRPTKGWDGEPILWGGESSTDVADDDEEELLIRVFDGMASPLVASLVVLDQQGQLFDIVTIRPDSGVFLVGVIGNQQYTVVARAHDDSILLDSEGREVRDILDPPEEDFPFEGLVDSLGESDNLALMEFFKDEEGLYLATSQGKHKIEDPELLAQFEKARNRPPRPRRA